MSKIFFVCLFFSSLSFAGPCSVVIANRNLQIEAQPLASAIKSTFLKKGYKVVDEASSQLLFQLKYTSQGGQDVTDMIRDLGLEEEEQTGFVSLLIQLKINDRAQRFYTAQSGAFLLNGFYERYILALDASAYSLEKLEELRLQKKISESEYDKMIKGKNDAPLINSFIELGQRALETLPYCQE
jgi:hypothetical protein